MLSTIKTRALNDRAAFLFRRGVQASEQNFKPNELLVTLMEKHNLRVQDLVDELRSIYKCKPTIITSSSIDDFLESLSEGS